MNLGRWVRDRARTTPRRTAIVFGDEEITYATLDERSDRLAAGLLARGLRPGDRVATLTDNRPEHVELFFACAKAGLILVPLNVRLTWPELAYQIGDAEPALLFTAPGHIAPETAVPVEPLTRDGLDALAVDSTPPNRDLGADGDVGADAGLLIVYTAGTTGRPKGALLTHANWMPAAEIAAAAGGIPEEVVVERFGLRGKHIAAPDEHVSDMAATAARRLMAERNLRPEDVDALVYFGSTWKDYAVWHAGPRIVHLLGLRQAMVLETAYVSYVSCGSPVAGIVMSG